VAEVRGAARPGRTKEALTPREEEILRLLASGRTNKEIAQVLCIARRRSRAMGTASSGS